MELNTKNQQKQSAESIMSGILAGMHVVETRMAMCEKHGKFEQQVRGNGKKSPCPHCEAEKEAEEKRKQNEAHNRRIQEKIGKCGIPKRHQACRVHNYHAVTEKQIALKNAVKAYIDELFSGSLKRNFVFLGNCGTGKTHLACAIGSAAIHKGKTVLFSSASEVIRRVQATHKSQRESEFELMNEYARLDLLILDEVGVQYETESAKRIITEIVNDRYNNELPTVFISNLSPAEFAATMGERAMSRMKQDGCLPFVCDWEDYRSNPIQAA